MSTPPVLSICIPTFNRLHLLRENLESLLPQALSLNVEVCVSDNASTDGTREYLQSLAAHSSTLRIQYQDKNVDIDMNMMSVISMGIGIYVYPLGDDDLIPADHLALLLKELESPVDLLVINGWHTDSKLVPLALHLRRDEGASVYTRTEQALEALWDKMPFGAFLASRECFNIVPFDRYVGSSHAYSGVIWDALTHLEASGRQIEARCTVAPVVLIRGAAKTWRAQADLIMLQGIPRWLAMVAQNNVCREAGQRILASYLADHTTMRELLRFRASGQLRRQDLPALTSECNARQARRIRAVAMIPASIVRLAATVAKSLSGRVRLSDAAAT